MAKYQLWDKVSDIYTPVGEKLTAQQWIARYSWVAIPSAKPVVAAGLINGAFMGELSQMQEMYANMGADFSECTTDQELLTAIEAFEDSLNTPSTEISTEERIASALEAQLLMSMPDDEEEVM